MTSNLQHQIYVSISGVAKGEEGHVLKGYVLGQCGLLGYFRVGWGLNHLNEQSTPNKIIHTPHAWKTGLISPNDRSAREISAQLLQM